MDRADVPFSAYPSDSWPFPPGVDAGAVVAPRRIPHLRRSGCDVPHVIRLFQEDAMEGARPHLPTGDQEDAEPAGGRVDLLRVRSGESLA